MITNPVAGSLNSQAVAAPAQKNGRNSRKGGEVSQQAGGKALTLPEDIVTLSTAQPVGYVPAKTMKPSQPVSPDEKNALLGMDSSQYTFSVYG